MYKLFVALRYLRRNWLNLVGSAAVAIGVLVLICVLSVMKGFAEEFRTRLRATVSDLVVESWSDDTFEGYGELMGRIERIPHVVAAAPRFEGLALIRLDSSYGKQKRFGQFQGIDLGRELNATDFARYRRAWRGRHARDQIEERLSPDADGLAGLTADQLSQLLAGLRAEDLDLMTSSHAKAVRTAAQRHAIQLQPLFAQADSAIPEWGAVDDPDKESPAFPGVELVVIGRDDDGDSVALDLDEGVVVFTPTDLFDGRAIRRCRIKGKFRSGLYDYDLRNIYLPLADVQRFMDKPGHVTSINIRLDSFDNAPAVRAALLGILTPEELEQGLSLLRPLIGPGHEASLKILETRIRTLRKNAPTWFAEGHPQVIRRTLEAEHDLFKLVGEALRRSDPPKAAAARIQEIAAFQQMAVARERNAIGRHFRVSTWEDKRRTFLRAVWLERRIMGFILFFVILIAGFLILSILHTTVLTKTKDIGILKSIGGSVGGIMTIFLLNGLFIGILGSGLGTLAGLLITRNINVIEGFLHRLVGFTLFPSNIYYLERIPVDKDPFWSTVSICVTAILVSFLASAYPAWKASRMDPVEALRYE